MSNERPSSDLSDTWSHALVPPGLSFGYVNTAAIMPPFQPICVL